MDVFHAVKASISTKQAAEAYGFKPDRSSMVRCPFHNDRTPSMKVDRRYYCFGCGATGDVIDFTARLFGLDLKDAALKLAEDFNIPYQYHGKPPPRKEAVKPKMVSVSAEYILEQKRVSYIKKLLMFRHCLVKKKELFMPQKMEDEWNDDFVMVLEELSKVEHLTDILLNEDKEYLRFYIEDIGREVKRIEERNIWQSGTTKHGDTGEDEADDASDGSR